MVGLIRIPPATPEQEVFTEEEIPIEVMRRDLEHSAPCRRRVAALALAGLPDEAGTLVEALRREPDVAVREAIATALAGTHSPSVAEAVSDLLQSEDAATRSIAVEVLAMMGDAARGSLSRVLRAPDPDTRILALSCLAASRMADARELALTTLAFERDANAVIAAIDVLSSCGEPDDAAALDQVGKRFGSEPCVEFAVDIALARLSPGRA